jgi:hypothetical protein
MDAVMAFERKQTPALSGQCHTPLPGTSLNPELEFRQSLD